MHLAYPRIYYVCGVVLCESFFALALLGLGPFALEVDLNRDMPPLPPLVTQMPLIVGIFFTVLAFVSLGIVGTIGIRMSLQRSRERSSGSRS